MFNGTQNSGSLINDQSQKHLMDALKVLDQAATAKGRELRETIQGSFKNLRGVFDRIEESSEGIENKATQLKASVAKAATSAISQINQQFAARPWAFLGSAAVLGGCVGFVLAKKMRSSK